MRCLFKILFDKIFGKRSLLSGQFYEHDESDRFILVMCNNRRFHVSIFACDKLNLLEFKRK